MLFWHYFYPSLLSFFFRYCGGVASWVIPVADLGVVVRRTRQSAGRPAGCQPARSMIIVNAGNLHVPFCNSSLSSRVSARPRVACSFCAMVPLCSSADDQVREARGNPHCFTIPEIGNCRARWLKSTVLKVRGIFLHDKRLFVTGHYQSITRSSLICIGATSDA